MTLHFSLPRLTAVVTSALMVIAACAPAPLSSSGIPVQTQKKVRAPYTGPVQIRYDNRLISPVLASYGFQKTVAAKQIDFEPGAAKGFQIQAVPAGPVVFQESFATGSGQLEQQRSVTVTDTSQRYTLHVEKLGSSEVQVAVNINGNDWVTDADFAAGSLEFTRNTLLLNASNILRVRILGPVGSSAQVTLVEAGAAGTVLQRRGQLGKPGETQATRVEQNDTNLFNPADLAQLGGLEPYTQIPRSTDGRSLPSFSLNNGVAATYSSGEFQIKLKPPVQANLASFLAQYDGFVTDEIADDEFLVKFNLEKANLVALPQNIQTLNAMMDSDNAVTSFAFDSLDGAQMFALMTELLLDVRQGNKLENIDINPILESGSSTSREGFSPNGVISLDADKSWWLRDTGVLDAWKYTMGFSRQMNRPVYVAVVDSNFQGLKEAMDPGQDLEGQVLSTRAARVEYDIFPQHGSTARYGVNYVYANQQPSRSCDTCSNEVNKANHYIPDAFMFNGGKVGHGTQQASTIASNINNQAGIAGIAPHAKIIPIRIGTFIITSEINRTIGTKASDIITGWDLRVAIAVAKRLDADVVSITSTTTLNNIDTWLSDIQQITEGSPYGWVNALQNQININQNNLIVVMNAGNAGHHIRHTLPQGRLINIVVSGAVMPDNNLGFKRALFNSDAENLLFGHNVLPNGVIQYNPGCSASNPYAKDCFMNNLQQVASVWWGNSVFSQDISRWEFSYGAHIVRVWTPGTSMYAVGYSTSNERVNQFGQAQVKNWSGTSASTPFAAASIALVKSLRPDLTISDLKQGNVLKYKQINYVDSLLKDFSSSGGDRVGQRLPVQPITLNVLDLKATVSEQESLHQNQLAVVRKGTLIKDMDGRPHLATSLGNLDLSMHLELDMDSTYPALFTQISQNLRQESYSSFWKRTGFASSGQVVSFESLINKKVDITGWIYQNQQKMEVKYIYEDMGDAVNILSIKSLPPSANEIQQNQYVYEKTGSRWLMPGQTLDVDAHEFVGINFNQPIRNLEIKIGPVLVPIIDVLENLVVFGIPDDLPSGVHSAIIKASNGTLTLDQVVRKASAAIPYPIEPSYVPPSNEPGIRKTVRIFNVSENDEARVYLNDRLIGTGQYGNDAYIELGPYSSNPLRAPNIT